MVPKNQEGQALLVLILNLFVVDNSIILKTIGQISCFVIVLWGVATQISGD